MVAIFNLFCPDWECIELPPYIFIWGLFFKIKFMKIRINEFSAGIEIELPDDDYIIQYRTSNFIQLLEKAKQDIIQIETRLAGLCSELDKESDK